MHCEHLKSAEQLTVITRKRGDEVREPVPACVVDLYGTQREGCAMCVGCHAPSVAETVPDAYARSANEARKASITMTIIATLKLMSRA